MVNEENGFDFKKLVDFRVLFLSLLAWVPVLAVLAVIVFFSAFFGFKYFYRDSMTLWSVQAQILSSPRSERSAVFYKPLDTKSIAEIIASQNTMQRVIKRMDMKTDDLSMITGLVNVTLDKNKPSVIIISVKHNQRNMAMPLASAVAEAGVEEYVNFQDGKTKALLNEAKRKKNQNTSELESLEEYLRQQKSADAVFDPVQELTSLQIQITECQYKVENSKIKIMSMKSQEKELLDLMAKLPKQIEGWRKVYGDDTQEIETLLGAYNTLRETFTDTHPRVLSAKALYEAKKNAPVKTGSDEVTYVSNPAYYQVQEKYYNTFVDIKTEEQVLQSSLKLLENLNERAAGLTQRASAYRSTNAKMDTLKRQIDGLQSKIEDYEFELNYSSAQDLEVFPLALSSIRKNEMNYYMISGIFAIFFTAMCVALIAIREIFIGKIKSLRELTNISDWSPIGELPDLKQSGNSRDFFNSAIIASFNNLLFEFGEKKILFVPELKNQIGNEAIPVWIEQFGVNGHRVFRLSLRKGDISEMVEEERKRIPHQELDAVADELINVSKIANKGFFSHSDRLFLLPAECELLKADMEILLTHYDMIILEYSLTSGTLPRQLFTQLAAMADYTLVFAAFNHTTKILARTLASLYKEELPDARIGAVLAEMRTPFIRK